MSSGYASRATPSNVPGGATPAAAGAAGHRAAFLEERVDVGRVDVQPDDVAEVHAGFAQDRLEVVEREGDLRRHVARMLRCAVGVDRRLAPKEQHAARALDHLALVEPATATDHCHGLTAVRSHGAAG